ncbi:hypothetical protein VTL71DRAFT_7252 [Oculimacula yallundae]|uniref:Uncharacterized protein n=1 Tax=Oculimacula yallundae TaxID=86028 RepID=A0ABR4BW59_9HELO
MDSSREQQKSTQQPKAIKSEPTSSDEMMIDSSPPESSATVAEALASMNKLQLLAISGCKYCGPDANCTSARAKGYVYDPEIHGTHNNFMRMVRTDEMEQFADHDPQRVINDEAQAKAQKEIDQMMTVHKKGPFCCGNLQHDPRSGSADLDDDKREPIMEFVKHLKEEKGVAWVGKEAAAYTDEELKAVDKVIRINRINDDANKATYVLVPSPTTDTYINILTVPEGHMWESTGPNGYLAFVCKEHGTKLRVGYSYKTMIGKKKTIATFGDGRLDKLLKVGKMERLVLGYGGPGW